MSRYNKILNYFKKASEDNGEREDNFAKKLLSLPKKRLAAIISLVLKEDEEVRDMVYESTYKSEAKLEDLA